VSILVLLCTASAASFSAAELRTFGSGSSRPLSHGSKTNKSLQQRGRCLSINVHLEPAAINPAYISALAALAGSIIGGLTSLTTSWLAQRSQARAGELTRNRRRRERLYRTFIEEASRLYIDALGHDESEAFEQTAGLGNLCRGQPDARLVFAGSDRDGLDTLTNERRETSNRCPRFMLQQLSPHANIDARRFETVDASDG
jgi:hypothetical protein